MDHIYLLDVGQVGENMLPISFLVIRSNIHIESCSLNESIVSFVSRCYMRVVNGSLVVCLSDYQSICIYSMIAVYWLVPRICRRNNKHEINR